MHLLSKKHSGFTLIEMLVVLVILVMGAAIGFRALSTAKSKSPTLAVTRALSRTLEEARQRAISEGKPVAIGFSTNGSSQSSHYYRLEGWNTPHVTKVWSLAGDFPTVRVMSGDWAGISVSTATPTNTKSSRVNLAGWLPAANYGDLIFCFTPDGGCITNGLPRLNGDFILVASNGAVVNAGPSGGPFNASTVSIVQAGDPRTLLISPSGGIRELGGLPGAAAGVVASGQTFTAPTTVARALTQPGTSEVEISTIVVSPNPEDTANTDEGVCIPGEYVSLEVYARDPEGRQLFAKWNQTADAGNSSPSLGLFTTPDGNSSVLANEVDRMEWVPDYTGFTGAPGAFRARWVWTVPPNSQPDDRYLINVDVRDADAEATITNPPGITLVHAPSGNIVYEKLVGGIWQIFRGNRSGTNDFPLSDPGLTETWVNVANDRRTLALLVDVGGGNQQIEIRTLDGTIRRRITTHTGQYLGLSMSHTGNYLAWYENVDATTMNCHTMRVDATNHQQWPVTKYFNADHNPPKTRPTFDPSGDYVIYEDNGTIKSHLISAAPSPGSDPELLPLAVQTTADLGPIPQSVNAPYVYFWPSASPPQWRMIVSVGNHDPVISDIPFQNVTSGWGYNDFNDYSPFFIQVGGPGVTGSGGFDDDFPRVSADGQRLLFTRSAASTSAGPDPGPFTLMYLARQPALTGPFVGPPVIVRNGAGRRGAWVR